MRLVYLSPVAWDSFAQRPHKFVTWFHARTGGLVLWINPYPTRLPALQDLRRRASDRVADTQPPDWLHLLQPVALPIEPLPGASRFHRYLWRDLLHQVRLFATSSPTMLAIGKPSSLALMLLAQGGYAHSLYDAMDDFPAFYRGLSRYSMTQKERRVAQGVEEIWASSSVLYGRWAAIHPKVQRVPNALDAHLLPEAEYARPQRSHRIFGYVGTLGAWFDWTWIFALSRARQHDVIRLIGPVFLAPPGPLPPNVELLPPLPHQQALHAMQAFDVGLIPFLQDTLTDAVDPIKYYEYRALGLPVLSTAFGEMQRHAQEPGVFISHARDHIGEVADRALNYREPIDSSQRFARTHTWENRFDATHLLP